jgi:DNA-binding CsgD family transcriptional regulator
MDHGWRRFRVQHMMRGRQLVDASRIEQPLYQPAFTSFAHGGDDRVSAIDRSPPTYDAVMPAWTEIYSQLTAADARSPLGLDDLEQLAVAAYLTGRDEVSVDALTRAHNESARVGQTRRAVRCAFWIVQQLMARGEGARGSGWIGKAQRVLEDGPDDSAAHGFILILTALTHLKRGDPAASLELFGRAAQVGDRVNDPELRALGRLGQGQSHAARGSAAEAQALFDEVMVAATTGEVPPLAVGVLYCAVIEACHQVFDLGRIREWTRALWQWCSSQPDLVPFRGHCLVHRVEVLRLNGDLQAARVEAEQACRWFEQLAAQRGFTLPESEIMRAFPVGAVFYQLGEIHRLRGDFTKAEEAYGQASQFGRSPEPGLALLRLAQERVAAADSAIRRALIEPRRRDARAAVLAAAVEILLRARDFPGAQRAVDELSAIAAEIGASFVCALCEHARGQLLLAEGDAERALAPLRAAWTAWQDTDAPYEAARVRVQLGLACRALGDEEAARLEFAAAQHVFQRLEALPELARVEALVAPGSSVHTALTRRELQVIALLASGHTNRTIAGELAISERTVDRHVSNILTKLGLPSRTAAAAYAYQHGLL